MKPRHKRAAIVVGVLAAVGVAVGLVLNAFNSNLVFFFTPSQAAERKIEHGQRVRLGGLVEEKSVKKLEDGVTIEFRVTDRAKALTVRYKGVLPDLFREGQGVVVQGAFQPDGLFLASTVLAKHDENYIPKEVADEMKKQGLWQHDKNKPAEKK